MRPRQIQGTFWIVILGVLAGPVAGQIAVAPPMPDHASVGKTWVVAIGVGKYEHLQSLAYTLADAKAFADAFEEVGLVNRRQVRRVTDGDAAISDAKALLRLLEGQMGNAGSQDTFVLFYAGHGYSSEDGKAFLAPAGFDLDRPAETGISMERLREVLDACPARVKCVILDACYSGGFSTDRQFDGQAAVDLLKSARGTVAICSSTDRQPSLESAELEHGVFTYWLVRGLRGDANSQIDTVIDAAELFRYVKDRVAKTADEAGGLVQQPTWGLDRMPEIPTVIELRRPDRPSVLVPMKAAPLPPDPKVLSVFLDSIEHFPHANARNAIGISKWVLANAPPGSSLARRAQAHIDKLDKMILEGTLRLPPPGEEE